MRKTSSLDTWLLVVVEVVVVRLTAPLSREVALDLDILVVLSHRETASPLLGVECDF